jgi:hypothetical protein
VGATRIKEKTMTATAAVMQTVKPKATAWQSFCRMGSASTWVLLLYSLATMVILMTLGGQPTSAEEGFDMLGQDRIAGLLRLDVLAVLVMPLYYVLFLSLYMALRKPATALVTLATLLVFAGLTLFLATPSAFAWLPLSDRFAASSDPQVRTQLIAAGEAILASDMWHGSGALVGGMLLQTGTLLISIAMLSSRGFGRLTAWVGIVTHGLDLLHIPLELLFPGMGNPLMFVAGPLYLLWFPLIARALWRLAKHAEPGL